jgi:hypothetical protein
VDIWQCEVQDTEKNTFCKHSLALTSLLLSQQVLCVYCHAWLLKHYLTDRVVLIMSYLRNAVLVIYEYICNSVIMACLIVTVNDIVLNIYGNTEYNFFNLCILEFQEFLHLTQFHKSAYFLPHTNQII